MFLCVAGRKPALKTENLENLQAAAICFFFGVLIWITGARLIAVVAFGCGVAVLIIPLVLSKFWADDSRMRTRSHELSGKPVPWYLSPVVLILAAAILTAAYFAASSFIAVDRCLDSGGAYDYDENVCRHN